MSGQDPKSHDASHRLLFSHQRLVADLLRFVFKEGDGLSWLEEIDFSSFQRENEASVDGRHGKKRLRDIVWSVRRRDAPESERIYILILIEFQSQIQHYMLLRHMIYLLLFYQDLIKSKRIQPGEPLPPVLPVLLYNGPQRWTAPTAMEQLMATVPPLLAEYQPAFRILLLEELFEKVKLDEDRNTVAAMMALQQSLTPEEISEVCGILDEWLDADDVDLREAFALMIRDSAPFDLEADEKLELKNMNMRLRENFQARIQQEVQEALLRERELYAQRLDQGKAEGRTEGLQTMLAALLREKFGPLSQDVNERLQGATSRQLEHWAIRVLSAKTLDDVWGAS